MSPATAQLVAVELTERDALSAHLSLELNISEEEVVSAWHAAWVSALSFTLEALVPLLAILLPPAGVRVPATFVAVLFALTAWGMTGARLGESPVVRATVRRGRGAAALTATFLVGQLLGSTGIV